MQVNPNHVRTLCALATLERRSKHFKAAKVYLSRALALEPTNPVALRVSAALGPARVPYAVQTVQSLEMLWSGITQTT